MFVPKESALGKIKRVRFPIENFTESLLGNIPLVLRAGAGRSTAEVFFGDIFHE